GEESGLYSITTQVSDINWVSITAPTASISASIKIRYLHKAASGKVVPLGTSQARVEFDEPQRAITPGQTAVFYRDDLVLGGSIIEKNS
ncbi:MAG: aminomethyltransferase beta-barrel domain-containing protein, partial [Candidatus Zixiibacteriota bacterium]